MSTEGEIPASLAAAMTDSGGVAAAKAKVLMSMFWSKDCVACSSPQTAGLVIVSEKRETKHGEAESVKGNAAATVRHTGRGRDDDDDDARRCHAEEATSQEGDAQGPTRESRDEAE